MGGFLFVVLPRDVVERLGKQTGQIRDAIDQCSMRRGRKLLFGMRAGQHTDVPSGPGIGAGLKIGDRVTNTRDSGDVSQL